MTVLALSVAACTGGAQTFSQDARYQETYAIVDARIEVGNGQVIEKGTVLVKKGRIAAVGTNVQVPSYAQIVKGDKLTVYPGFIDAYCNQYLKLPEWQPNEDVVPNEAKMPAVSMRDANRKGMRPQLAAYTAIDSAMAHYDHRKAGFTSALLVPSGGMFNGSASLVELSGRPARESVLVPQFGMALTFSSQGGGYPNSQMGVMAHIRQTLWDAASFNGQPHGPDPALGSLKAVLAGQVPTLVDANQSYEITRAIRLADEFKLKPILVGGAHAGKRVAEIKAKGAPVILTLNWSAEPKPKRQEGKPGQTPAPSNVPEEVLNDRQATWLETVQAAKKLADANVPFAFSTRGSRNMAEFTRNLRRCIAEGLPKETAMRALTLEPARMLGMERELGTVEVGKRANLTIVSGDFTKDDAKIPFMLINGLLFKPETDRAPRPQPQGFNFGEEDEEGHPHP
jgi:imidazolonepropionase-like amidohydrolase